MADGLGTDDRIRPYDIHQSADRYDIGRCPHQHHQQIERESSQLEVDTSAHHALSPEVDDEVVDMEQSRVTGDGRRIGGGHIIHSGTV